MMDMEDVEGERERLGQIVKGMKEGDGIGAP
jgi:hypothetical protein